MGLRAWAGASCAALALALSGVIATPAYASPTSSVQRIANYEAALAAYQGGRISDALSLAKTAARDGSSDAAVMAGYILSKGETGLVDKRGARRYFEMGANLGHPDAIVALGEMGVRGEAGLTKSDAVSYLTRASDMGRTDASRALADLYRTGQGTVKDPARARELLSQAAGSFDREAAKTLGDSLFETDPKAALKHYEQAAQAGHVEAAYIAGVMYAENYNIRPNSQRSASLLAQAAKGGHAAAQADYGLLVYQGAGVPQSTAEAAKWFEKSARGGDAEGQFLYAFTLAKGEGVTQSYEDAYYWLLKSGQAGVDDYDKDRQVLRERLEANVDPAILARAKSRL